MSTTSAAVQYSSWSVSHNNTHLTTSCYLVLPRSLQSVSMIGPLETVNASGIHSHMYTSETQVHSAFKFHRCAMYYSKWVLPGPIVPLSRLCLRESQWTHAPFIELKQTLQALLDFFVSRSHQCPATPVEHILCLKKRLIH